MDVVEAVSHAYRRTDRQLPREWLGILELPLAWRLHNLKNKKGHLVNGWAVLPSRPQS